MFTKLTYKQKSLGLVAAFLFFMWMAYSMSFSKTFRLVSDIKVKEEKISWLKAKEKELPAIQSKMKEFEAAYSKNDSSSVRDKLTSFISEFAEQNNCLVTEIPGNSSFKNDNLKVQTNTFTIRGNFHNLLQLLHQLENNYKYVAKIMSTRFFTIKDLQNKRKNLYLTIITQSFQSKGN